MAFVYVIGPCYRCLRLFSYNPFSVPSQTIDATREPVCRTCLNEINQSRMARGLAPIVPAPGAYDPDEFGGVP